MPHCSGQNAGTLVVAVEDNPFWLANMPPLDQLPSHFQQMIRNVYTNKAGELSARCTQVWPMCSESGMND